MSAAVNGLTGPAEEHGRAPPVALGLALGELRTTRGRLACPSKPRKGPASFLGPSTMFSVALSSCRMIASVLKRVGLVACLLLGALVVFRVVYAMVPPSKPVPSWVSTSGLPPPLDFLYVMFPSDDAVPLFSGPDGEQAGVLERAVTNTQQEISGGRWVAVQDPNGQHWVQLSRLEYLPPPGANRDYVAAFVAAYKARAPGEQRDAKVEFHPVGKGVTNVRLHLRQEDHWQDYIYDVSSGRATPREMNLVFGPGEAIADLGRFSEALCSAAAFVVFVGVGAFLRTRAVRR